jgi:NAD(P)-dependent dehydrogenase (short-subunit alcohol dehydrogenase family)
MERLSGRGALVSGGGQGLGRAIAKRLAAEGAVVTVADINTEKGEECVAQIEAAGGGAQFVQANVAKDDAIQRTVDAAAEWSGGLSVLVNVAQYFAPSRAFELVSMKDWELSEATGPRASFRFMQLAYPHLRASSHGSVINFTSGSAIAGIRYTGPYSAAKGAILAITKVAANEWARDGVRVNAMCPFALTDVQRGMIGGAYDNYTRTAELCPMGRGADPDAEIAPVVAFLASDDAAFVTGTVMHADGGLAQLSAIDYSSTPGVFDT